MAQYGSSSQASSSTFLRSSLPSMITPSPYCPGSLAEILFSNVISPIYFTLLFTRPRHVFSTPRAYSIPCAVPPVNNIQTRLLHNPPDTVRIFNVHCVGFRKVKLYGVASEIRQHRAGFNVALKPYHYLFHRLKAVISKNYLIFGYKYRS